MAVTMTTERTDRTANYELIHYGPRVNTILGSGGSGVAETAAETPISAALAAEIGSGSNVAAALEKLDQKLVWQ